jgi:galactose-1-phosphate uridylyltransferase
MIEQSKAYHEKKGANFWQELIESEKQIGERYIGKIGNVEWLTSFCPMGQDEFQGIVCGKSNFMEFDAEDIKGISEGLSKIFKFYKEIGMSAFNFIIYSGPLGERCDEFWSSTRIVARANFAANYVSDIHLAPIFYLEAWYFSLPEALAASFRRSAGF